MSYIAIETASLGTGEYLFLITEHSSLDSGKIIKIFKSTQGQLMGKDFLIFKREKSFKESNGSRIGIETILLKGLDVSMIKSLPRDCSNTNLEQNDRYKEMKVTAFDQLDNWLNSPEKIKLIKGKSLQKIYPYSPKDLLEPNEVLEYKPKNSFWLKTLTGGLVVLALVWGFYSFCLPGEEKDQDPKNPKATPEGKALDKKIESLIDYIGVEDAVSKNDLKILILNKLGEKHKILSGGKLDTVTNNKNKITELETLLKEKNYVELLINFPFDGSFPDRAKTFSDFCKKNGIAGVDFKKNTTKIIAFRKNLSESYYDFKKIPTDLQTIVGLSKIIDDRLNDKDKKIYEDIIELIKSTNEKDILKSEPGTHHPILSEKEIIYFNKLKKIVLDGNFEKFNKYIGNNSETLMNSDKDQSLLKFLKCLNELIKNYK